MSAIPATLFVSETIHERKVSLADGTEHSLYFREVPSIDFRRFYKSQNSEDDVVKESGMAKLIAASLCEPDGTLALTEEQALRLTLAVKNAVFVTITSVNRLRKEEVEAGNV